MIYLKVGLHTTINGLKRGPVYRTITKLKKRKVAPKNGL